VTYYTFKVLQEYAFNSLYFLGLYGQFLGNNSLYIGDKNDENIGS